MPTFRQIAPATWALFWRSQTPAILFLIAIVWASTTLAYKLMLARWFLLLFKITSAIGISLTTGYYAVIGLSLVVGLALGFVIFTFVLRWLLRAQAQWPISVMSEVSEQSNSSLLNVSWYLYWRFCLLTLIVCFLAGFGVGVVVGILKHIIDPASPIVQILRQAGPLVAALLVCFWALGRVLRHSLYRPIGGTVLMFRGMEPPARWHYWAETR